MFAQEFVVAHIVEHNVEANHWLYMVRWYGYAASDDSDEPAAHFPQQLIARFWKRTHGKATNQARRDTDRDRTKDKPGLHSTSIKASINVRPILYASFEKKKIGTTYGIYVLIPWISRTIKPMLYYYGQRRTLFLQHI